MVWFNNSYVRFARENEAAGAADAAAWVMSAVLDFSTQIVCGSQGGPCDPSTQNHAGRTPASSLLGGYYTTLHPVRRKVRATLRLFSGPPGSAAHSGVPGPNSSRCRSCRPARVTNHLCALRFFYVQTLEKPWSIADTPYPKKTDAVGSESS